MHHISNDKRSRASLDLIRTAFYQLVDEVGLEAVTVSAIAARAGVGRTTFYRLFDDKHDVLLHDLDEAFNAIESEMLAWLDQRGEVSEEQAFARHLEFWMERSALLDHVEACQMSGHFTSRVARMVRANSAKAMALLGLDEREMEYLIHVRAATFTVMLQVARHRFPRDTPAQVAHTMARLQGNRTLTWS